MSDIFLFSEEETELSEEKLQCWNILIVDDEPGVRQTLTRAIHRKFNKINEMLNCLMIRNNVTIWRDELNVFHLIENSKID